MGQKQEQDNFSCFYFAFKNKGSEGGNFCGRQEKERIKAPRKI